MSVQPAVKSRIVRLHAAGRGRNQIARELSISTRQVDRVCREAGLEFDTARTMKAAQARRSSAAQDRSELAADARALAARVLADAAEVEEVRMAWKEDIAPVAKRGGDRRSTSVTVLEGDEGESPHNESADGILRRLKRDHPDLAQEVIDGTTTATAGS